MKRIIGLIVCGLAVSIAGAQFPQDQPSPFPQGPGQQPGGPGPGPGGPPGGPPGGGPPPQMPGGGQDPAQQAPANNVPGPQWVREGMRLSYAVAGQQQAPNAPLPSLLTVDVVSLARGQAGLDVRAWAGGNNAPLSMMKISGQFAPVSSAEYWMNPDLARAMITQPVQGMQAAAAQLDINGKQIQTIRITNPAGIVYDFDAQSGVMMMIRSPGPNGQPGMSMTLVDMRQRKLPWTEGRPPSWLSKTRRYTYSGSVQQGDQGGGMGFTLTYDVLGAGPNAINVKRTMQAQQMGGQPDVVPSMVMGPTQFGGIFIPPLALKTLKQGQALDEDKMLGTKMTVDAVGKTPYGRNVVTIVEENQGYAQYCDYELETGIMLVSTVVNKAANQSAQIVLVGRQ